MLAFQSVDGRGPGSSSPRRCRMSSSSLFTVDASRSIFCVDFDVVERKVAGPHRGARFSPMEHGAHRELGLLHRRHALLFALRRIAPTLMRDAHGIEV